MDDVGYDRRQDGLHERNGWYGKAGSFGPVKEYLEIAAESQMLLVMLGS